MEKEIKKKKGPGPFNKGLQLAVKGLYDKGVITADKDIVHRTGYGKSTVSEYVGGNKEASIEFIEKFENVFELKVPINQEDESSSFSKGLDLIAGVHKNIITVDLKNLYEERIKDLKEDKAFLQEILKTSLARIVEEQGTLLAYQKAWVDQHAEEQAEGDPVREKNLRAKMSRRVGEHELGPVRKDKV